MKREEIKARGKGQMAKGREQRAESLFAVDFSQRIKRYMVRIGLQPHTMWLKPKTGVSISLRQLKQTAIHLSACRTGRKQTTCPDISGNGQETRCQQPAAKQRISTVFYIYRSAFLNYSASWRRAGGWTLYQTNRQLGLPADKIFNN